ncbi:hypothetical protein DCCM_0909 [Desulfocucumis palustris]|uniref:Uncharacterized protein n=1 Tax=Desulfocucumis palustris TaxID=1898651 RepID=A0A2L2XAN2_9FIRM|nr:hypothetical protein [Desulfocucumis palustris]GBF32713.1 hypothetical protein DCCM_0909 [Desulfocucumis palustris]
MLTRIFFYNIILMYKYPGDDGDSRFASDSLAREKAPGAGSAFRVKSGLKTTPELPPESPSLDVKA